jgi:hypothetical protein
MNRKKREIPLTLTNIDSVDIIIKKNNKKYRVKEEFL